MKELINDTKEVIERLQDIMRTAKGRELQEAAEEYDIACDNLFRFEKDYTDYKKARATHYDGLQMQLDGLKTAIDKIQKGIDLDEEYRIHTEVDYFAEKQRRVLSQIEMLKQFPN